MPGLTLLLAIAQIVFWGAGYYGFVALLPFWRAGTGWSLSALAGGFTLSLLVTAVFSPVAGRWIDKGGAVPMTFAAAALMAVALVGIAGMGALWQFYALCAMIGVARAGLLYEPCFAVLTRHMGAEAKGPITRVALVAGFATLLAFPAVHAISTAFGWQVCMLVLAALVLCVGMPCAVQGFRQIERNTPVVAQSTRKGRLPVTQVFVLLAIAFALIGMNHVMLITHILPLLAERGVAATVATGVAAAFGPMQVVGRLAMVASEGRMSATRTAQMCLIGLVFASLTLWLAGTSVPMIALFAILQGAAYGVTSIVRPVLTRERLGQADFGLISGRMGAAFMLGSAAAPLLGGVIAERAGYDALLLTAAACAVCGALALAAAGRYTGGGDVAVA